MTNIDPSEALPLYGERFQESPAELYRQLRRELGPVAPVLLEGDIPAWLVLGYRELHQVTRDSQLFARDSRRWNQWDKVPEDWPLMPWVGYQPSVMFTEGDEHRRRAGAISESLAGIDQFELQGQCAEVADGLIDSFAGRGKADLMAEYAYSMPLRAGARVFGLGETETDGLVEEMIGSLGSDESSGEYFQRAADRMERLVQRKRGCPATDMPSRLLAQPAGLTDQEAVVDLLTVLTAAQMPTAYWIGNTLRLMLTDLRFALSLSGARRSVGQALNEVLWEDTPTQNFLGRWATRDTMLGGKHIRSGDLLVLGLAAANTDPQVRPPGAPEDGAGNRAQMSFGHGEHGCPWPAPEVAEVIAQSAVEVLLDRLPDVSLAVEPEALTWVPSVWMRGLAELPVTFTPAD